MPDEAYHFAVAMCLAFLGLYFLASKSPPMSSMRKYAISIIALFSLLPIIYALIYFADSNVSNMVKEIASDPNKEFKTEIASLLARGETVALGTMAIFIPILLALWNNFNSEFMEVIKEVDGLTNDIAEIKKCKKRALSEYEEVLRFGEAWRWSIFYLYVLSVFAVIILATLAIYMPSLLSYKMTVAVDVMAHILLLASIIFLGIFITQVQPVVSRLRRCILEMQHLSTIGN